METITPEIRNYLDRLKLGFIATVSVNNVPHVSPKGTIIAWDKTHLVFANIKSPQTIKNLEHNPLVEINVIDPFLRKGFRFSGTAKILSNGDEFSKIVTFYKKHGIQSKIISIVKIKLDNIKEIKSPLYDLGMSEDQIKSRWKKIYSEF